MGYNYATVDVLAGLIKDNQIRNPYLIDLGAQDFYFLPTARDNEIRALGNLFESLPEEDRPPGLKDGPSRDAKIKSLFNTRKNRIPMQSIFDAMGVEYLCCDVEKRAKTLSVDLNFDVTGLEDYAGIADICTNHGNSEHLMNQSHTFQLMHDLTKQGGGGSCGMSCPAAVCTIMDTSP